MKRFKVIEVKINEYDGVSYEYVTKIDVSYYGEIVIVTSPNVLEAMKFMDEAYYEEKEKRELMLKLVKTHFPKKDHTISYRTLIIDVK
jgi:hypothetical protein